MTIPNITIYKNSHFTQPPPPTQLNTVQYTLHTHNHSLVQSDHHSCVLDLVSSQVTDELILPSEGFRAGRANLQASHFVLGQVCQNSELHVTPRTGALHSFLSDTVDQLDMALQIPICSKNKIRNKIQQELFRFGPKMNTKIAYNTTHHSKLFDQFQT